MIPPLSIGRGSTSCRHCATPLKHVFTDFGWMPPSNAYLKDLDPNKVEHKYPLRVLVCHNCWLVQTEDFVNYSDIFNKDYAYFSSMSQSFLQHAERYVDMIVARLGLTADSSVLEIASNDGYLLQNFVEKGIPCLGIEPTESTAVVARSKNVPTMCEFFSEELAKRVGKFDLIIGNNVYAHVPDINDFTNGLREALNPGGTITLEFPHLAKLIEFTQFDTIYHEHFSYLSLTVVNRIFAGAGLRVYDVEKLDVHGGSLRVYGCHRDDMRLTTEKVYRELSWEKVKGLCQLEIYESFQGKVNLLAQRFRKFIKTEKAQGRKIAAIGAAAKGNTLLNYSGVNYRDIDYVIDNTPAKIGKYLPGSHIPIVPIEKLKTDKPDWLVVLPWNFADEIVEKIDDDSICIVVAVPELKLYVRGQ